MQFVFLLVRQRILPEKRKEETYHIIKKIAIKPEIEFLLKNGMIWLLNMVWMRMEILIHRQCLYVL